MAEARHDAMRFEEALSALKSGEFDEARGLFGLLLEMAPEDVELQAGYYSAGFWANRDEAIESIRSGRALAAYLMEEWDVFEQAAEERGYLGCMTFYHSMKATLGRAADNFRLAFQEESNSAIDYELLAQLAVCLIRLEDYSNAADILIYARRNKSADAKLLFLLGESLCHLGDEALPRGLSFYRDACLLNHKSIDPALISSQPATATFESLYEMKGEQLEATLDWFPAYLHLASFVEGLRKFSERELEDLHAEVDRLTQDLSEVVEKFRDRVRARLCFYHLILIYHHRYHEPDHDSRRNSEEAIQSLDEAVYAAYKESQAKR